MSAGAIGAAGYRFLHRKRKRKPVLPKDGEVEAFERSLVERFGISPARAHELAQEQASKQFPKERRTRAHG